MLIALNDHITSSGIMVMDLSLATDPEQEPEKAGSASRVAHRIGGALSEVQASDV
jgi:hypothetical protein